MDEKIETANDLIRSTRQVLCSRSRAGRTRCGLLEEL